MKSILSFFKKNLFINLFLCCTLIITSNSFSQSKNLEPDDDEFGNLDFSGVPTIAGGVLGLLVGGLIALIIPSPSPELAVDNDDILNQRDKLIQNNKPLRLSVDWGKDKFGTIKSINKDYVLLNEEQDSIKITEISSIMDLKSAAQRNKVFRTKYATFTIISGIGFCIGASGELKDSNGKKAATIGYGIGIGFFVAAGLIIALKSDAEKEGDRLYPEQPRQPRNYVMNLHLQIGTLNLGVVHTTTNVVYSNIQPCVTAKLCF
jgi:hypothetical protein